jgi:hypothetical protein
MPVTTAPRRLASAPLAALVAALLAGWVACATPPSPWQLDRAEQELAAGKPALALQYTERALQFAYDAPSERLIALHLDALRRLDRGVEADALAEFTRRFDAGEDTDPRDTNPSWRECRSPTPHDRLVRDWADGGRLRWLGHYEIGVIAGTVEIDEQGEVDEIRVLRAKHPAAAWLLIEALGAPRVSPSALDHLRNAPDASFPKPVCVWWDYERNGNRCFLRDSSSPPFAAPAPVCGA